MLRVSHDNNDTASKMKIQVDVKLHAKTEEVVFVKEGHYIVKVHQPPVDGKANQQVIQLLAKHLCIPKSYISLVSGAKSKKKVFEIST